jgi:hypothetical protein
MAQKTEYKKPDTKITNHNLEDSIKGWCEWCWQDRVITTNGKCRVCGAMLVYQKHWKPTLAKIKLINEHGNGCIPVEINKRIYFVPVDLIKRFKNIEHQGQTERVSFVEEIRLTCKSFPIERG